MIKVIISISLEFNKNHWNFGIYFFEIMRDRKEVIVHDRKIV